MTEGLIPLNRAVLRLEGQDCVPFLHDLLTQNIEAMADRQCAYGALLTPQGKVLADMMVWRETEHLFYLDIAQTAAAALLKRLTLYRLRAAVNIEDTTGEIGIFASFAAMQQATQAYHSSPDPRFPEGGLGTRCLAPTSTTAPGSITDYENRRLGLGVPDLSRDAGPEEVFGLEALLEELHGVDFHKGCFVGQENVSRMKRRATTRRKFCAVAFEGEPPAFGTPITAGTATIGDVRTGKQGRAIALLRLDRAQEAEESGQALMAADRPVRLEPPPWLILPTEKDEG